MKTRTAVVGVVKFNDKILFLKRSPKKESSPVLWQPVSGSIRGREFCEDAVLREIKEETNLDDG